MIYSGKEASIKMQKGFQERIRSLDKPPVLAILSVGAHRSMASFIKIKRKYAEDIGVTIKEFSFSSEEKQSAIISKIQSLAEEGLCDGIIVQLPLPDSYETRTVLDAIPEDLDVDVLGSEATAAFEKAGKPIPPVAEAVAHVLLDTATDMEDRNVVIVGRGRLVGIPVATWFMHQGVTPQFIDIATDEKLKSRLLKEADIIITGTGVPKILQPSFFKEGIVLVDAGTSEQGGTLSGDCDPACAERAKVFTPVPGGIGPLTVAYLFENVLSSAERKQK